MKRYAFFLQVLRHLAALPLTTAAPPDDSDSSVESSLGGDVRPALRKMFQLPEQLAQMRQQLLGKKTPVLLQFIY